MDWSIRYRTSRSVTIRITGTSELVAANSISRPAQMIASEAIPVLQAFASGATPREAFSRLSEEWEIDEDCR